jgi:branched-chain amino acid aminotransferase
MLVEPGPSALTWLDGEFVPWSEATMHLCDHHYGVGVFEGVRAYGGEQGAAIFRLREHTKRLLRSAHMLRIRVPDRFDEDTLNRAQVELVQRNGLADAYLRPFIFHSGTFGLSPRTRGLRVRVAIMALAWSDDGAFAGGEGKTRGITLRTASFSHPHGSSALTKAKANANYLSGVLAREEAQDCGADEAMLLDREGFVTETSGANLFAVLRGVVCTPPLDSVLEGVTRATVISLLESVGTKVVERRMTRDDIYAADEVFLTGTAAEITPIREVDGRAIGSGAPGDITRRVQGMYTDAVRGRAPDRHEWLTRIQDGMSKFRRTFE